MPGGGGNVEASIRLVHCGGERHKAQMVFVENFRLVTFSHFRSLNIREGDCVNVFWFGLDNRSTR